MAYGKREFIRLARNLALSLKLHCPDIPLAIVTDAQDQSLRNVYDHVIPFRPEWGKDFHQKRHLQDYSPFEKTLFIDADCLVFGDLASLWDLFGDVPFGVLGWLVTEGPTRFHPDTQALLARLERPWLPLFNEGVYYFDSSTEARAVFSTIAQVMDQYDDWGLTRLGGKRGVEPPMAVALALHGIEPIPENNRTANHTYFLFGPMKLDVLGGRCRFYCRQREAYVEPLIVHLLWPLFEEGIYHREVIKLRMVQDLGLPRTLVRLLVNLVFNPPYAVYAALVRGYKRLRKGGRPPILPVPLWPVARPWPPWIPPWKERLQERFARRRSLWYRGIRKLGRLFGLRVGHPAGGRTSPPDQNQPQNTNTVPVQSSER